MRDYGSKYKRWTFSLGRKTTINKHGKFINNTEVNGKDLNTVVKNSDIFALKGGKKKLTRVGTTRKSIEYPMDKMKTDKLLFFCELILLLYL